MTYPVEKYDPTSAKRHFWQRICESIKALNGPDDSFLIPAEDIIKETGKYRTAKLGGRISTTGRMHGIHVSVHKEPDGLRVIRRGDAPPSAA